MSTGSPTTTPATPVLKLSSLLERHPGDPGVSLLHLFGPCAPMRLTAADGETARRVTVRWTPRDRRRNEQTRPFIIDWTNCPQIWGHAAASRTDLASPNTVTEFAAIAVMGLLIHELETAVVEEVLPIGSGGDYNVRVGRKSFQVEASGVKADTTGHETAKRILQKSRQVLKRQKQAFAFVTTFEYKAIGVYSQLLFVPNAATRRR